MRILHTADWHLGNRLGRIDRTSDLRRSIERIGQYCEQEAVDVLLVAGDLFSEHSRADALRETIEHWEVVFNGFLEKGGTILALTGNHDNENFCQTLSHAMSLAAPSFGGPGEVISPGRLYLATEPKLLRLRDAAHPPHEVQFILLPYPTPGMFLTEEFNRKYDSLGEKNQKLTTALLEALRTIQRHPRFDRTLPTVLSAHLQVQGAQVGQGIFTIPAEDDVTFQEEELATDYAYVALGHVHKPQAIAGHDHIRYSGSIERMDLGEANDAKGVVLLDIGPRGLLQPTRTLPLPATRIYEVQLIDPLPELRALEDNASDCSNDLVKLKIRYDSTQVSLEEILDRLDKLYPRWYERDWTETNELSPPLQISALDRAQSFRDTVLEYIRTELIDRSDQDYEEKLSRIQTLLDEEVVE